MERSSRRRTLTALAATFGLAITLALADVFGLVVIPAGANTSGSPSTYSQAILADHPTAYYQFSDSAGATSFADSSGNGNNATSDGSDHLVVPGPLGPLTQALSIGDGAHTPELTPLLGDNARTVELWFKTTQTGDQCVLSAGSQSHTNAFSLCLTNGEQGSSPPPKTPGVYLQTWDADIYIPNLALTEGNWHYIAATLSGSTATIAVDGQAPSGFVWNGSSYGPLTTQPFTLPLQPNTTATPVGIGSAGWHAGFSGEIGEVAIYPTALTAAQLAAHYAAAWSSAPPSVSTTITSPDYKVVQFIRDFNKSPEKPSACPGDLMYNLGVEPDVAVVFCLALQDSHNPDPPASLSGGAWNALKASDEYRSFVHLAPVTVDCVGGVLSSYDLRFGEFEQSPGFTPSPLTRRPFLGADYYDGPSFLPDPWSPQYHAGAPRVTVSGNSVYVSYSQASRLAGAARLGAIIGLGYDAPFIWTRIVEKVTCDHYTTLIFASAFPAVVTYANDQVFGFENQEQRLGRFILSGGPGGLAGQNNGPVHNQGQGYFFPDCNVFGDPANQTDFPIPDFTPGPTSPATCGVQPLVAQSFGGGGYISPTSQAVARGNSAYVTVKADYAGAAKVWLVGGPGAARSAARKKTARKKTVSSVVLIASGHLRLRHPGVVRIRLHMTLAGSRMIRGRHTLHAVVHGLLIAPGRVEPLRAKPIKLIIRRR
jgi:Concanavalin A-like lectin/glucanases superfamily